MICTLSTSCLHAILLKVGVAVAYVSGPMHVLAPLAFFGRVGEAGAEGGEDRFEGAYPTWIS